MKSLDGKKRSPTLLMFSTERHLQGWHLLKQGGDNLVLELLGGILWTALLGAKDQHSCLSSAGRTSRAPAEQLPAPVRNCEAGQAGSVSLFLCLKKSQAASAVGW